MSKRAIFYLTTFLFLGGVILLGLGAITDNMALFGLGILGFVGSVILRWAWRLHAFIGKN